MNKARLAKIEKAVGITGAPYVVLVLHVDDGPLKVGNREFTSIEEAEKVLSAEQRRKVELLGQRLVVDEDAQPGGGSHE